MKIHFLHIGKTGGTAFQNAIRDGGEQHRFHVHGHTVGLADVPVGEKLIFFLRHPVSRYVSAFYSRYRQGQPMTFRPWKPEEERAFTRFPTANALAEALSSPDPDEREAAEEGMRGIGHVKSSFYDWVASDAYFHDRSDDIWFIGLQETFEADLELMRKAGILAETTTLPTDDVKTHRMPVHFDRHLSEQAIKNLTAWYAADIDFYLTALAWRRERWPQAEVLG